MHTHPNAFPHASTIERLNRFADGLAGLFPPAKVDDIAFVLRLAASRLDDKARPRKLKRRVRIGAIESVAPSERQEPRVMAEG